MWALQYVSDVEMTPKHGESPSRGIFMRNNICVLHVLTTMQEKIEVVRWVKGPVHAVYQ